MVSLINILSSTSPQRSIWLHTSTVAAKDACSAVRCLFTKARAITKDFVVYVARSNACTDVQLVNMRSDELTSYLPFPSGQR